MVDPAGADPAGADPAEADPAEVDPAEVDPAVDPVDPAGADPAVDPVDLAEAVREGARVAIWEAPAEVELTGVAPGTAPRAVSARVVPPSRTGCSARSPMPSFGAHVTHTRIMPGGVMPHLSPREPDANVAHCAPSLTLCWSADCRSHNLHGCASDVQCSTANRSVKPTRTAASNLPAKSYVE